MVRRAVTWRPPYSHLVAIATASPPSTLCPLGDLKLMPACFGGHLCTDGAVKT
jgi:hypothetical protein